jgi:DNA polymerase-3 subunit alpha
MNSVFEKWVSSNLLKIHKQDEQIFTIDGVGKFLLLEQKDLMIDDKFNLNLSKSERKTIEREEINFIVYEFGGEYYFSKTKGEEQIPASLEDFKYLGEAISNSEELCYLGIHDEYELLNGSSICKKWIKKAKFLGYKSLGMCDRNTLAGILSFQSSCLDVKIKPILGETLTVLYDETTKDEQFDLKFFVKNKVGWRNLLLLNKIANVDNDSFVRESDVLNHSDGLILVFPKESIINEKETSESRKIIKKYKKHFEHIFYQFDSVIFDSVSNEKKKLLAQKRYLNELSDLLEPVLINDSYYLDKEDYSVKKTLNSVGGFVRPNSKDQHFKTLDESLNTLNELFDSEKEFPIGSCYDVLSKAVSNSMIISDLCDFTINTSFHKLPKFEYDGDNIELFRKLLKRGWKKKIVNSIEEEKIEEYEKRLQKESKVIEESGFVDYFLILWDIVKWAKENDILVGPGRGSVGGSLVSFLLDITTIDPIKFDLLFERFLNETRVSGERAKSADSLPDIDIDFSADRRDDVKRYIEDKYGKDYVASIGTYTRMKLKGVLKDFARADGNIEFSKINFLTKNIDDQLEYEWSDLFKYASANNELKKFVQENYKLIFSLKRAMNQVRQPSIHASAIVIVPKEDEEGNPMTIYDWMPVRKVFEKSTNEYVLVSEWEGKYIDKSGFLKEDLLGLRQLDKFRMMIDLIRKNRGEEIVLEEIPLEDKDTYKIFKKGFNEDVFQLGTPGLKKYTKDVRPKNIDDLIAITALYRPGPKSSNAHNIFVEIRRGEKEPEYDYMLKEVTEKTFGLYIYQEQIMKAVNVLGNLSLVEADEIRTVMKKFQHDKMKTFETKFKKGAIKNGCDSEEANAIWEKLRQFSGYGFNRSHSAAYTLMTYWSQWLKCKYPEEFYTTSFNYYKESEMFNIINEIRKRQLDIKLNPPDVNKSRSRFTCDVEDSTIYWSLKSIKGVGDAIVKSIVKERRENGKFNSLEEFVHRMKGKKCGRNVVESLILSGSFDKIYDIRENNIKERKELLEQLYEINKIDFPYELDLYLNRDYNFIRKQKELTGFGVIDFYKILFNKDKQLAKYFLDSDDFLDNDTEFKKCTLVGEVFSVYEGKSKKGKFANLNLLSNDEILKVTMWSDTWEEEKKKIEKYKKDKSLIAISGKIRYNDYNKSNTLYTDSQLTKIIEL